MKKLFRNSTIVLVSLMLFIGRNAYAYRDSISPEELYGESDMTSEGVTLMFVLVVLVNGGFFLMLWFKKKRIQKENLKNLRKLTENPDTPASLREMKNTSELFSNMKNIRSTFSRLEAEKIEKQINEKGEYVGFILENDNMWQHHSTYMVFELRK